MDKKAVSDRIRNDLFWHTFDKDGQRVTWQGYDDSFWWEKVATSDQFQVKNGLRLDPFTGMVSEEKLPIDTAG